LDGQFNHSGMQASAFSAMAGIHFKEGICYEYGTVSEHKKHNKKPTFLPTGSMGMKTLTEKGVS
jgi:hypothetical protein